MDYVYVDLPCVQSSPTPLSSLTLHLAAKQCQTQGLVPPSSLVFLPSLCFAWIPSGVGVLSALQQWLNLKKTLVSSWFVPPYPFIGLCPLLMLLPVHHVDPCS